MMMSSCENAVWEKRQIKNIVIQDNVDENVIFIVNFLMDYLILI